MNILTIRVPLDELPSRKDRALRHGSAERVAMDHLRGVAAALEVPVRVIAAGGRSGDRRILFARRLVSYTLRTYAGFTYQEIARVLHTSHACAFHHVRKATEEYLSGTEFEIAKNCGEGL